MILEGVLRWSPARIIDTITDAEPIGPKKMLDLIVVAPCTGIPQQDCQRHHRYTCYNGSEASLRNQKPVVLAIATNDGLSKWKNIGTLLTLKTYFCPFRAGRP